MSGFVHKTGCDSGICSAKFFLASQAVAFAYQKHFGITGSIDRLRRINSK
jgi:hypothetical protein